MAALAKPASSPIWRAEHLEAGVAKMTIEGQRHARLETMHDGERCAIGEAHRLIGEFAHPGERLNLIGASRGDDLDAGGSVEIAHTIHGKAAAGLTAQ